jgi:hypothetical protein
MTLSNISALCKRSGEMWSWRFWSFVKIWGSIFRKCSHSQILRNNLSHCFPVYIKFFCYSLTPNLRLSRFERTKVRTLSTFASVLCVLAAHFLGHIAQIFALPWTAYAIQKKIDFFIAYSPYAIINRANVSLVLFPISTQNLMFIRCSRFMSFIFPPWTRTTSAAAWEQTAHLVRGYCKRKLESVQKCLGTGVYLTQHSRGTLQQLRELNCHFMYIMAPGPPGPNSKAYLRNSLRQRYKDNWMGNIYDVSFLPQEPSW